MILGIDNIAIMIISKKMVIETKILNNVCRIAQAAAIIAPQGPPDAVPVAISDTAFPVSTPAFTVEAVALAVASAP